MTNWSFAASKDDLWIKVMLFANGHRADKIELCRRLLNAYGIFNLTPKGDEHTAIRFVTNQKGEVVSMNQRQISLVHEVRK